MSLDFMTRLNRYRHCDIMKKYLFIALIAYFGYMMFHHSKPTAFVPQNAPVTASHSLCHIRGQLPDQKCTPGVSNPNVNQANIHSTICVKGWTKTIRPPVEYTSRLKQQSIQDYGYSDTNPRAYEEDHLISLELGGDPTAPNNLWAEPNPSPNNKDIVENQLNQKVCNGSMSLLEAQKRISTNWATALQ